MVAPPPARGAPTERSPHRPNFLCEKRKRKRRTKKEASEKIAVFAQKDGQARLDFIQNMACKSVELLSFFFHPSFIPSR